MRAAGVMHDQNSDLEALIEAAETALAAEAQFAVSRQKAEERRADAARAEAKLRIAKEADLNWLSAWRQACAGTWLGEAEGELALGAVKQSLKALDELRATLSVCAELEDRIAKMERDKRLFADEVGAVAAALNLKDVPDDARQRADAVEERVARARENARRRAEKADALKDARERLRPIAEEVAVNARQASAMTAFFAVETLAEVAAKLEHCKRRDELKAEIAREKAAIMAGNVAGSLEAARFVLEQADAAALTAELVTLKARAPHDDQAYAEAHSAHREAVKRLEAVGGDDAVARLEEKRRTILEAVNDGARRYLTLRAGIAAAEEALRLFRDRHRGAMMERASEAFRLISRGAYRGADDGAEWAVRDADRARRRRRLERGGAIIEGRAVPALSGVARRGLSRARQDAGAGAVRRRRHHGDVRSFPRRGGAAPVRRHGTRRPGHLLHPPSALGRDRQGRVPGGEGARIGGVTTP